MKTNLKSFLRITSQVVTQWVLMRLIDGRVMRGWWIFLRAIFSVTSFGIEVLLRRKFGERYLTFPIYFWTVLVALFWYLPFRPLAISRLFTLDGDFGENLQTWWRVLGEEQVIYALILWLLGAIHISAIHRRNSKREKWHSYSNGISHLTALIPYDRAVKMWVEPILVFLVGGGLFLYTLIKFTRLFELGYGLGDVLSLSSWGSLSLYFIVAALSLFGKGQIIHREQRKRYLDAVDAQIESEVMKELMDDGWGKYDLWPKLQETYGVNLVAPPPQNEKEYNSLARMFTRLDPSLQELLDKKRKVGKEGEA